MSHTKEVTDKYKKIPEKRRKEKWAGTIIGAVFIIASVAGVGLSLAPWWAGAAGLVLGGFLISQDQMKTATTLLFALFRDGWETVKGKHPRGD